MSFCPECGSQVSPGSSFCAGCGAAVGEGQAASPKSSKPAEDIRSSRRRVLLLVVALIVVVAGVAGVVVWRLQPSAGHQRVQAVGGFLLAVSAHDANAVLAYAPDGVAKLVEGEQLNTGGFPSIESEKWSGDTLTIRTTSSSLGGQETVILSPAGSDEVLVKTSGSSSIVRLTRESTGWKITSDSYSGYVVSTFWEHGVFTGY